MRYLLCALLLGCSLSAQEESIAAAKSGGAEGAFYVDGIVYHYTAGTDYIVVAAAHSVLNRKFLAVKVRVYNTGKHSVTLKPEDVLLEDAVAGHAVSGIPGTEIANRMRKPYNMARFGVGAIGGAEPDSAITSDMVSPQMLEMMHAIAARSNGGAMPGGSNVLYTDTPGALESDGERAAPVECDQVCHLRNGEAKGADALTQLERQAAPDAVERWALLANTIPPRGNVVGVLYYPMGKFAASAAVSRHTKKGRMIRVTVPVGDESFRFLMPVE